MGGVRCFFVFAFCLQHVSDSGQTLALPGKSFFLFFSFFPFSHCSHPHFSQSSTTRSVSQGLARERSVFFIPLFLFFIPSRRFSFPFSISGPHDNHHRLGCRSTTDTFLPFGVAQCQAVSHLLCLPPCARTTLSDTVSLSQIHSCTYPIYARPRLFSPCAGPPLQSTSSTIHTDAATDSYSSAAGPVGSYLFENKPYTHTLPWTRHARQATNGT